MSDKDPSDKTVSHCEWCEWGTTKECDGIETDKSLKARLDYHVEWLSEFYSLIWKQATGKNIFPGDEMVIPSTILKLREDKEKLAYYCRGEGEISTGKCAEYMGVTRSDIIAFDTNHARTKELVKALEKIVIHCELDEKARVKLGCGEVVGIAKKALERVKNG